MDTRKASDVTYVGEDDCEFCSPRGRLEWFNRPLASDGDYAIAIPSIGSFVPGYILVVPTEHVTASCRISSNHKARFASFAENLAAKLASIYQKQVTVFEHGACASPTQQQSACINHAHIHLIPGNYDLMSAAPSQAHKHSSLEDFLDQDCGEDPYLMLRDPDGPLLSFEDRPAAQFFRRIIAQRLEIRDHWDYAMFPFFENVIRTYKDFGIDVE